ncbi:MULTISPECIES: GNAT family N-acetyltransferase [Pseudomonas]|jgi:ribosomal protein S18 acetylase RimI-like enzyme|uniref:Acetyltransferase n=5 Tax=Pseudomonas fluorescens group TaxID=136843 RepID=C3K7S8_PSEFS|nr:MULTISPECIES: GNAT family N-acetyltransferase [Pseudomonas]KJZ52144.1 GNAT family acetyltransferase [Pseudomonas marginalis]KJZ55523.1 GNAT family acetyltransferase [Pseudomonas marginalis]MBZ6459432.1 GNAT family N-acetyltransferase [Pseudomonas fluorescens group sp.]MBZ6465368.1 GNAT family N-acetyltransferase [Pseudomonas fluorescens group sp.]MBZ6471565.1 GNAT family N-acetyltransferase [Pseudomonas fluorescens group sp.]
MAFNLRAATDQDLPFARSLTFAAMSRYYLQYELVWSNQGFDIAWAGRENWLICNDDTVMGFISLSADRRALYIRELHMLEAYRGLGAGSWVLEQMALKAQATGLLRLTVFKNNPAKRLYQRSGMSIVGEEDCFWRMERVCR